MRNNLSMNNPQEEKMHVINSFLDRILEENNNKKGFSKIFGDFKTSWNSHRYLRLGTGVALSAGAIGATASGAFILAGGLLAGRAMLSAVGGYISTEAIFDIINKKVTKNSIERLLQKIKESKDRNGLEEELRAIHDEIRSKTKAEIIDMIEEAKRKHAKKEKVKKVVAISAGFAMGILGGTKALEAATAPGTKEAANAARNKVVGILSKTPERASCMKVDQNLVKDVFNDIRHDHPNQHYVTLEQTVRRIKGLKRGIPLNESSRLNPMNPEIASSIRKPGSEIMKAMKDLGYVKNGETLDHAARKLSEEKLTKVILKSYPQAQEQIHQEVPNVIQHMSANPIQAAGEIRKGDSTIMRKIFYGTLGFLGIGAGLAAGKKILEKRNDEGENKVDIMPIVETPKALPGRMIGNSHEIKIEQPAKVPRTNTVRSIQYKEKKPDEGLDPEEEQKLIGQFKTIMNAGEKLGFGLETVDEVNGENVMLLSKATVGGAFAIACISHEDEFEIIMKWYDHGVEKLSESRFIAKDGDLKNNSEVLLNKFFEDTLLARDIVKCRNFAKELRLIEVEKNDLKAIYDQIEHPEVKRKQTETGGFWYQDIYSFDAGVLKMKNMQNPKHDEMNLTNISFGIKEQYWFEWDFQKHNDYINRNFDKVESEIMWRLLLDHAPRYKTHIFPGASFAFNWHKHPGNLPHPSPQDLSDPSSHGIVDLKLRTAIQTYIWGIAVALQPGVNECNKPSNSIILRGKDFGGEKDYILNFWRVNRNQQNSYSYDNLIPVNAKTV